jgi:futalosine hydrolase
VRILIVTATRGEVAPLVEMLEQQIEGERMVSGRFREHLVDVLTTGIGMVSTAVWCTRALGQTGYDVAVNLGVCGSFNPQFDACAVVHVTRDRLAELGIEDGSVLRGLAEVGLCDPDPLPFSTAEIVNDAPPSLCGLADLAAVSGITVNTVHGNDASIAAVVGRCQPDVESMEGAAFMYACRVAGVPFAQVRAVSNRVERRNRAAWNLPGAIASLNNRAQHLLRSPS